MCNRRKCCCFIVGPPGPLGPSGAFGPTGPPGSQGTIGLSGSIGVAGPPGTSVPSSNRTIITTDYSKYDVTAVGVGNNPLSWDMASPNTKTSVYEITPAIGISLLNLNNGLFLKANNYHISIILSIKKTQSPTALPPSLFVGNALGTPVGPIQNVPGYNNTVLTGQPFNVFYDYYVTIPTSQIYYVFLNNAFINEYQTPVVNFRLIMWNVELIQ